MPLSNKKHYFFSNLQSYFSEFYFFGLQNKFVKRRFIYLVNYTENMRNFFIKIQTTSLNFFKCFLNFIYLFLIFLEVRSVNAYIYYITSFPVDVLTTKHKQFAGYYSNSFGNFEGISNQLMYKQMLSFCNMENFVFHKSGLILNFSSFFHTMSALRFFRNTDNIVGSLDFSNYVDYVMFNNLNLNNISEQFMYSFFHDYAFQHNFNYPLKQFMVRTLIYGRLRKQKKK